MLFGGDPRNLHLHGNLHWRHWESSPLNPRTVSRKLVKLGRARPLNPQNSHGLSTRKSQKLYGSAEPNSLWQPGRAHRSIHHRVTNRPSYKVSRITGGCARGTGRKTIRTNQLIWPNPHGKLWLQNSTRGVTPLRPQPRESSRSIHNRKTIGYTARVRYTNSIGMHRNRPKL